MQRLTRLMPDWSNVLYLKKIVNGFVLGPLATHMECYRTTADPKSRRSVLTEYRRVWTLG